SESSVASGGSPVDVVSDGASVVGAASVVGEVSEGELVVVGWSGVGGGEVCPLFEQPASPSASAATAAATVVRTGSLLVRRLGPQRPHGPGRPASLRARSPDDRCPQVKSS